MRYLLFLCYVLITANRLSAQSITKQTAHINGQSFVHYEMQPPGKTNGVLILLTAKGEKPRSVFDKTKLPQLLSEKGYLTIIPELNSTFFADQNTIEKLDYLIKFQSEKSKTSNFFIGGLSMGGAIAISYAEQSLAKNTTTLLKGVIVIDAPLDLERVYASAERKIKYGCGGLIMKEGYSIKNELNQALNGSPDAYPDTYLKYSSYSANAADGGNAKFLKNIPIRLYTEPDLDFVRSKYCQDLQNTDLNAFDLEGLSKFLLSIGNKKVEYITTKGRGFHSWNIIEPVDCTNWILSISN